MTDQIRLEAVSVRLGSVQALAGVHMTVGQGERIAIVGSNGSGKSTLLRVLHGLQPPSEGRVDPAAGLRRAMVFQRPFVLRASVLFNVALGLWIDGARWPEARQGAVMGLERVGLSVLAQRRATTLSGGQLQRVALARAWVRAPDVLLLDEPTASLDPHAKREVEALMAALAQRGSGKPLTMIFASHNMGQVKRLASRVLYLQAGRLLADLPTADFFNPAVLREASAAALAFLEGEVV